MFDYILLFFVKPEGENGTSMAEYAIILAVAVVLFMAIANMTDMTSGRVDEVASELDATSLPVLPIS